MRLSSLLNRLAKDSPTPSIRSRGAVTPAYESACLACVGVPSVLRAVASIVLFIGRHFAAWEEELFAGEMRAAFKSLR
jgi:hypothetical protein